MDPLIRLVLVEDESITALDVARQLGRLGYHLVAVASSGPQAIQQARTHHPDIVLMDIHLQGMMDGVDAARHIQASAPISVIYMSANVDGATLERIRSTDTAGFAPKPIHFPTPQRVLQRALSAQGGGHPGHRNASAGAMRGTHVR
jgi:two-component system, cell cycle sensor histidine kinase and response regulator CckA